VSTEVQWQDGQNYEGTVVGQDLRVFKDNPVLVLTFKITGKYKNRYDYSKGADPIPGDETTDIWLYFSDQSSQEKSFKALKILGETTYDFTRYSPEDEKPIDLTGRKLALYYKTDKNRFYISTNEAPYKAKGPNLADLKKFVKENADSLKESVTRATEAAAAPF
jgi:hypothetical protein